MSLYGNTKHQKAQIALINKIADQAHSNAMQFSTVAPVDDYENDSRIALTSVHFPHSSLIQNINDQIIKPLKVVSPDHYYYPLDSLHLTIKNVRLINEPPTFNSNDIDKVKNVFEEVISKFHTFKTYFYRLILFPASLALVGTTDPELDLIHLELDHELKKVGVPDNKKYLNSRYFFCNITLVRFTSPLTLEYKRKINELSHTINIDPYEVDSATLLSCNATMNRRQIIGSWKLK